MQKTPLESWIAKKILGLSERELIREDISRYQWQKLRIVIDRVRDKSPFYRDRLRGISGKDVRELNDLSALPMTTDADLRHSGSHLLCVSQSEVARVVTLNFPQSAPAPKRIYFTEKDLELTIDFFHHGMTTLVKPGQTVLILMPGDRPGSVGDLLSEALGRAGSRAIVHGIVQDPAETIRAIVDNEIGCLVGIPTQVLALARHQHARDIPAGSIKSVLLSTDYVPSSLVTELGRVWQCKVFSHYGTTEMGLGGGVECEALAGYHFREADLLFEIVDPFSGKPVPDGEHGEIVFTTLTREAMPLVRYRTGDLSRFRPRPCSCGTVLRRMEKVRGKVNEMVQLRSGDWLGVPDLDEALFALPGIVNYDVCLTGAHGLDRLQVAVYPDSYDNRAHADEILATLATVPAIAHATETGNLLLEPIRFSAENWISTGVAKRVILQKPE
jgi:phenylacetate-CoA ligase